MQETEQTTKTLQDKLSDKADREMLNDFREAEKNFFEVLRRYDSWATGAQINCRVTVPGSDDIVRQFSAESLMKLIIDAVHKRARDDYREKVTQAFMDKLESLGQQVEDLTYEANQ